MKRGEIILMIVAGVFGLVTACQPKEYQDHTEDTDSMEITDSEHEHAKGEHRHGDANAHMHKMDFDQLVERFESPEREDWQKPMVVMAAMPELKGKKVMDLGAGTGYFSFRFVQKGAEVIAADADERFIEFMNERREAEEVDVLDLETRLVPYESPALQPEEVDIFFSCNTYHHIEQREEYLEKVKLGLKPAALIVIVDFKKEDTPHGPPMDMRVSVEEVIREMESIQMGLKSKDLSSLPEQYILIFEPAG